MPLAQDLLLVCLPAAIQPLLWGDQVERSQNHRADGMPDPHKSFLHLLFRQHAGEISAFLRGRRHNEADVADIVQESLLRLSEYQERETISNPRAFLFQTAANLLVDQHRRRARRERYLEPDMELESLAEERPSLEIRWVAQEALEYFCELLEQLPEVRRHAFVLFRIEGLSHREIAARLGISVRSSERHVVQAMQFLARAMSPTKPCILRLAEKDLANG
jgi:RNA polymerase sigma-70 factor (ECF subfamily)